MNDSSVGPYDAPIGVFDSGLGGLTVLQAIRSRLPSESTVYLGDSARIPYGPKSPDTIQRYSREAAVFLAAQGVKAIVVACNTATSVALEDIRSESGLPVLGVIEPGAQAAAAVSVGGRIGVIGTAGTIASGAYERAIRDMRPEAVVLAQACPLFVPLVEEGWTEGQVPRLAAEAYLEPLLEERMDTLVLACTHYPLLADLLEGVVGPGVQLVNSAQATAASLTSLLKETGLAASPEAAPEVRYFVTDEAARFSLLARRLLGERVENLTRVSVDSTV
ncbi:MAG: glutamate racemase [Gemmatimonadota bacterium]